MKRKMITDIISILFIIMFVYAAVGKLLDMRRFEAVIMQTKIFIPYATAMSWFIPLFELVICLILIFYKKRIVGFYLSTGLMMAFTVYVVWVSKFSAEVPCACGGILEKMSWNSHIVFNIFFTILGVMGIRLESSINRISNGSSGLAYS